ncbi:type II toxin-antitoxin system death-on-curing family toxin [Cerasicoccus fimbriatus]|uniref:type II toxin-antitoxin system death-on-curing family toxin n=1 Tax=Cerasicoccus fimbriatus TaxID=3014554 RepID=UPI0022B53AAC|nr:type II toxin-antitoxin system death-on-curing family toxin [Cerasicoccus sp. TK19100]
MPVFLTTEQVERLHRRSLDLYGGQDGLRDRPLFEGSVAQAQQVFVYEEADVFGIAAAYCFHLAQAQAFVDGNKRTAVAAGLTFLNLNGIETDRDISDRLYDAMIAIANRQLSRQELADLLRELLG